jgi:hypothetical protein
LTRSPGEGRRAPREGKKAPAAVSEDDEILRSVKDLGDIE